MQFHQGQRLKEIINLKGLEIETLWKKSGLTRSTFFRMLKDEQIEYSKINKVFPVIDCTQEEFYRYNMYEEDAPVVRELKAENTALKDEVLQLHREAAAERKGLKKTRAMV